MSSDSCLLGSLASYSNPGRCLDIGTGTGVVALMLAQRYPTAHVTAIEIQESVYNQAFYNITNSSFSERIEVRQGDFLQMDIKGLYDLIVCNPPYFSKHLPSPNPEKNIALHNTSLPFEKLASKVQTLLSPGGKFWLILPPSEMEQFNSTALTYGLFSQDLVHVYNKPGKLFRKVASFSASAVGVSVRELTMHDADGKRTADYETLMSDFYLENTEIYRRLK